MLQEATARSTSKVFDLGRGGGPSSQQIRADMENMLAGLRRHYGEASAMILFAEAFAGTFSATARESGKAAQFHYALDLEIQNAFTRAHLAHKARGAV